MISLNVVQATASETRGPGSYLTSNLGWNGVDVDDWFVGIPIHDRKFHGHADAVPMDNKTPDRTEVAKVV